MSSNESMKETISTFMELPSSLETDNKQAREKADTSKQLNK